jgi:hypothetical protein
MTRQRVGDGKSGLGLDPEPLARTAASNSTIAFDRGQPSVGLVLYTQPLTPEKFDKLDQLHWSPAIFQVQIHKAADACCKFQLRGRSREWTP